MNASTQKTDSQSNRAIVDPDAVMQIKHLPLRARAVVEGVFHGLHGSPFFGFSSEFSEYRRYTAGDDTKFIDWRLYARSDRLYIKQFEDETNRRCLLVVDQSRSMAYGSGAFTKSDYTRTLAATFAYFLNLQRDCVGLMTYDDGLRDYLPARYRPGHLRQLMGLLEKSEQGNATDVVGALKQVSVVAKKRGLIVILSDFLTPTKELRTPLAYLRSRGHEVWALRVLDPMEATFAFAENATFEDIENRRQLFVDTQLARKQYLRRFQAHASQLSEICTDLGIDLSTTHTDAPLKNVLFEWLLRQNRMVGKTFRRNARGTRP